MKRRLIPFAMAAMTALLAACSEQPGARLPELDADRSATSVSGISSGAYMAGQFEMAHAKDVIGVGIIAGGPYGCSESLYADVIPGPGTALLNLTKAINGCMLNALQAFGVPDPKQLADRARQLADRKRIDPIEDVVTDRIYLFSGKEDRTVVPAIVKSARTFYEDLGVPSEQILFVDTYPAGHAFVTEDRGQECDHTGKPYIVDCDYDQAGAVLKQMYGTLKAPSQGLSGKFEVFDQEAFTEDLSNHGLSDDGIIYVPQACRTDIRCKVHIAFHGCGQNRTFVGDAFVRESGYARWADTNDIIVLFPQTAATPLNPQGCWDWWGYTGPEYLTREAPQIIAVYRMLERLSTPRTAS
jgi:hypothetical protein